MSKTKASFLADSDDDSTGLVLDFTSKPKNNHRKTIDPSNSFLRSQIFSRSEHKNSKWESLTKLVKGSTNESKLELRSDKKPSNTGKSSILGQKSKPHRSQTAAKNFEKKKQPKYNFPSASLIREDSRTGTTFASEGDASRSLLEEFSRALPDIKGKNSQASDNESSLKISEYDTSSFEGGSNKEEYESSEDPGQTEAPKPEKFFPRNNFISSYEELAIKFMQKNRLKKSKAKEYPRERRTHQKRERINKLYSSDESVGDFKEDVIALCYKDYPKKRVIRHSKKSRDKRRAKKKLAELEVTKKKVKLNENDELYYSDSGKPTISIDDPENLLGGLDSDKKVQREEDAETEDIESADLTSNSSYSITDYSDFVVSDDEISKYKRKAGRFRNSALKQRKSFAYDDDCDTDEERFQVEDETSHMPKKRKIIEKLYLKVKRKLKNYKELYFEEQKELEQQVSSVPELSVPINADVTKFNWTVPKKLKWIILRH